MRITLYHNSIIISSKVCGRSYGGGVKEILPGEVGIIMIPKIPDLSHKKKNDIINQIDNIVRNNQDVELDIGDQKFIDLFGVGSNWCEKCRKIWEKLQQ
ncbi:MAG: hypothetical protein U0K87_12825 [Ruminococcus sp.]|nr:hypothetical protein [Ruminococcus sp.]